VLTDRGRAAADRVAGARRARLATLLDAVPADERDNVLRALDVLTDSLSKDPSKEIAGA
jgi:DNA-binding MarR family transcriptional regulator